MTEQPPPGCPECGAYLPHVEQLLAKVSNLELDVENLQLDLRAKRATISRMRGDRNDQEALDPVGKQATEVFEHWRQRLAPKAREFTGKRFAAVTARLKAGYSVDELKRAVDGCALSEFHTKQGEHANREGPKYTDLGEHICRNEKQVQAHLDLADEADRAKPAPPKAVSTERLVAMQRDLDRPAVLSRLQELRGWAPEVCRDLGLGLERGRIVFPVRNAEGYLCGLTMYQPNPELRGSQPKMLAQGERDLFPRPEDLTSSNVWLVEGEPDAVAMRTIGYPTVAVPGLGKWRDEWAERFEMFDRVYICFDCDGPGRETAAQRLKALAPITAATVVDLDPDRDDGYDLTDLLHDLGTEKSKTELTRRAAAGDKVSPIRRRGKVELPDEPRDRPFELLLAALERRDCQVKRRGDGAATACCPVHDDRVPSMSLTEGQDGRVLFHCHAGCEPEAIVQALDLDWRELFVA